MVLNIASKKNYKKTCGMIIIAFFILILNMVFVNGELSNPESASLSTGFSIDYLTGELKGSVSLFTAPGINGNDIGVDFVYGSSSRNEDPDGIGAGWSLGIPKVVRDTKDTPYDTTDDTFNIFLGDISDELVLVDGEYVPYHLGNSMFM
ncbi:MAG: hypothetical protein GXO64_04265, partial [Candidatus Micrarchaeota archaeon]|nr:hypothetical protein [Candidatus Micrarchaeota archaeon]